jgi:hypothetical protein
VEDKSTETKIEIQKKKIIIHVKDEPVATAGQIASSSSTYKTSTTSTYKSNPVKTNTTNTYKSNQVKTSTTNTSVKSNQVKSVNTFSNAKSQFENQNKQATPPARRPPPTPKKNKRAKAMYDYQASGSDEISLREGDIIIVLEQHPDGWWLGELNGKRGLFPGNYTEIIS